MDIVSRVSNNLNDNDEVEINIEKYEYNSSSIGKKLRDNDLITNVYMDYLQIKIESDETVAEARICQFEKNYNYIQSVEVKEKFRGNGIGKILFKHIIYDLIPEDKNTIYIKPTNEIMKYICKRQGFSKSDEISSWYEL